LAETLSLPGLKSLASSKIHSVNSTAKGEIAYARYVYAHTHKDDTTIRAPVANFWATRSHTLRAEAEDEFRSMCLEFPQFGYDVLSKFPFLWFQVWMGANGGYSSCIGREAQEGEAREDASFPRHTRLFSQTCSRNLRTEMGPVSLLLAYGVVVLEQISLQYEISCTTMEDLNFSCAARDQISGGLIDVYQQKKLLYNSSPKM